MEKTNLPLYSVVSFQDLERAMGTSITVPPDKAFYPPIFHPLSYKIWVEIVTSDGFKDHLSSASALGVQHLWNWVVLRFERACVRQGKPAYATTTDRTALHELYIDVSDLRRRAVRFLNEYQLFRLWELRQDKRIQVNFHLDPSGMSIETTAYLKPLDQRAVKTSLVALHPGPSFHGHNRGGVLHRKLFVQRRGSSIDFEADLSSPTLHPMFKMVLKTPKRPYLTASGKLLSERQVNEVAYRQVWLPLVRLHRVDAVHASRLF